MEIARLSDREIVRAILDRDTRVTKEFLYRKCYPLFKAVFDKYYTDCETCFELINEIYVYIMIPQRMSGISKLAAFGFRCSLTMWLKIVVENYCRQMYARRIEICNADDTGVDRKISGCDSLSENTHQLNMDDLRKILDSMPNPRYRKLIEYRYIDEKSNEETAALLGLSMPNYYNSHKRAREQYSEALRKDGLI